MKTMLPTGGTAARPTPEPAYGLHGMHHPRRLVAEDLGHASRAAVRAGSDRRCRRRCRCTSRGSGPSRADLRPRRPVRTARRRSARGRCARASRCCRWRSARDLVPHALDEVQAGERGAEPLDEHGPACAQQDPDRVRLDLRGQADCEAPIGARAPARRRTARPRRPRRRARGAASPGPRATGPPAPRRRRSTRRSAACPRAAGTRVRAHQLPCGQRGVHIDRGTGAAEAELQLALGLGERIDRMEVPDQPAVLRLEVDRGAPLHGQRPQEREIGPPLDDDVDVGVRAGGRRLDVRGQAVLAEDRLGDRAVRVPRPGDDLLLEIELERAVERLDRQLGAAVGIDVPARLGREALEAIRDVAVRDLDGERRLRLRRGGRAGSSTRRRPAPRAARRSWPRRPLRAPPRRPPGRAARAPPARARCRRPRSRSVVSGIGKVDRLAGALEQRGVEPGVRVGEQPPAGRVPDRGVGEQVEPVAGADLVGAPRRRARARRGARRAMRTEPSGPSTADDRGGPHTARCPRSVPSEQLRDLGELQDRLHLARALVVLGRRAGERLVRSEVGVAQDGEAEVGGGVDRVEELVERRLVDRSTTSGGPA